MEPIEGSETSAFKPQTPGKYPKENILHKEHGESLKSIITSILILLSPMILCAVNNLFPAGFLTKVLDGNNEFCVLHVQSNTTI